jgi:hypothetical protein
MMGMLHDTRVQVHDALQAAAGVGRTLLPPRPDDSHHSFAWSEEHGALVQDCVDGRFRAGLRLRDLTLLIIDGRVVEFPLRGHTVEDGFRFYEEATGFELDRSETTSGTLAPDEKDLAQLARMYGQAAAILERLRVEHPSASPARLWPHHFDIAILIGNIGVGFLAGDDAIDEPYWYVYNTPMPEALRPLSVGEWYRGHWTGAVLRGDPDVATIETFLREAIAAVSP